MRKGREHSPQDLAVAELRLWRRVRHHPSQEILRPEPRPAEVAQSFRVIVRFLRQTELGRLIDNCVVLSGEPVLALLNEAALCMDPQQTLLEPALNALLLGGIRIEDPPCDRRGLGRAAEHTEASLPRARSTK